MRHGTDWDGRYGTEVLDRSDWRQVLGRRRTSCRSQGEVLKERHGRGGGRRCGHRRRGHCSVVRRYRSHRSQS